MILSLHLRKQIAFYKFSLNPQAAAVLPGCFQRLSGDIHPDAFCPFTVIKKAQQNTAASGTHIQHPLARPQQFSCLLHQNFRILAGNQHMGIHNKFQLHKPGPPQNMLQRLPHSPPFEIISEPFLPVPVFFQNIISVGIVISTVYLPDFLHQIPGIQPRIRHSFFFQKSSASFPYLL